MINGLPLLPLPVVPIAAPTPAAAEPADFMAVLAGTAAPVTPPLPATPAETPADASLIAPTPPTPTQPAMPMLPHPALAVPEAPAPVLPALLPPKPVHAKDDDGETQVIALPWHLQANIGLSWASGVAGGATTPGHAAATALVANPPVPTAIAGAVGTGASVGIALRPPATDASAGTRPPPAMVMPRATNSSNERSTATGPTIGTDGWYAPWVAWPDRLLRWHGENDGSASAWVRDYRLDAGAAAQLVESLRELAGQQQISLRRIVLNGHELWRAPTLQTPR